MPGDSKKRGQYKRKTHYKRRRNAEPTYSMYSEPAYGEMGKAIITRGTMYGPIGRMGGKMSKTMKSQMTHAGPTGPSAGCDSTFDGLHHWFKHVFEHLGWMILAKERGMNDKTMVYKNSIKRLKESIEYKIKQIHDKDKKEDLKIMWHNVNTLMKHAEMDL